MRHRVIAPDFATYLLQRLSKSSRSLSKTSRDCDFAPFLLASPLTGQKLGGKVTNGYRDTLGCCSCCNCELVAKHSDHSHVIVGMLG